MRLTVNGKVQELAEGITVSGLVLHLGLDGLRIAVELNREVVRRAEYTATTLKAGDTVEVVTFVGGG
jgi:sulfur carrier protein